MIEFGSYQAPYQASPGELVTIKVPVRSDIGGYLSVTVDDALLATVTPDYLLAEPWLESFVWSEFSVTFIMPNQTFTVNLYAWSFDGSQWQLENSIQLVIVAATQPSVFSDLGANFNGG